MAEQAIPSGSIRLARVEEAILGRDRRIVVKVGNEEQSGMYRCQTDMGVAMLVAEADLEAV